jgi:hypothetical protein
MLSTKEQIKTAVLNHLKMLPTNNAQVEAYTLSSISESITADSSKVATALSELANEDLVTSRKVQLDVYVPKNQEGFRILSSFASKEYIGFSPYWAIVFVFGLFLVILLAFGNFPNETYIVGVRNGAILSFLVCFFGGGILQNILIKFRRWQLVSEESYRTISDLIKHSLYAFIPPFIVYYLILTYYGRPLESTVIVGLLAISVACSFGYEQVKKTKT